MLQGIFPGISTLFASDDALWPIAVDLVGHTKTVEVMVGVVLPILMLLGFE